MNRIRGRKELPSRPEREFWRQFPELLIDDPEDMLNELIGLLRTAATTYWDNYDQYKRLWDGVNKAKQDKGVANRHR